MTHAEFRARHRCPPGLELSECEGELALAGQADDDGHRIELWRCVSCGHTIPYDLTDGRIRNDYPDPRQIVRELAEAMRVRRS